MVLVNFTHNGGSNIVSLGLGGGTKQISEASKIMLRGGELKNGMGSYCFDHNGGIR